KHEFAATEVAGLQELATTFGDRLTSLEAKIGRDGVVLPALTGRSDQLQANVKPGPQSPRSHAEADSPATQVGKRQPADHEELERPANHSRRKRIDFEAPTNRPTELAPGVYLSIRRLDPEKHEIDGFLQLGQDGPGLSIRGQGLDRPILFHGPGDSNTIELVLTKVDGETGAEYGVLKGGRKKIVRGVIRH